MTNNWSFPATESGFAEAMRNHQTDFHGISFSESAKKTMVALGPISAARMFQIMTEAFFVHMLGTPPDGTSKKKNVFLYLNVKQEYSVHQWRPSAVQKNKLVVLFTCIFCFGVD
jgi:hypothetical protein